MGLVGKAEPTAISAETGVVMRLGMNAINWPMRRVRTTPSAPGHPLLPQHECPSIASGHSARDAWVGSQEGVEVWVLFDLSARLRDGV